MKRSHWILLVVFFSGCGHAPAAYHLRRQGLDPVLFPPTKVRANSSAPEIRVSLKDARRKSSVAGCDIESNLISLHWEGTAAVVSLRSQSFFVPTADQAPTQTDRGVYFEPLEAMEKFRADLLDRQAKGCLQAAENIRLRRSIVENLPLPPVVAYFFQLGSYDVTGYFDLTTDFRMITTSPLYQPGATPSPETLIGYETAHYIFVPPNPPGAAADLDLRTSAALASNSAAASSDDWIRLSLSRATDVLNGNPAIEKRTLQNDLHFSQSPGYFRLLFMADESSSDRITRAILLSAPDQEQLAQAVAKRQGVPDDFCATLSMPAVTCTVFPKNFGVSPELRVRANGQDFYIRVGGFLQEVLDLRHPENGPPKTLRVRRPFHGRLIPIKFDPKSSDILKLVVLPGDEITW